MNYRNAATFLCVPCVVVLYFLFIVFLWAEWADGASDDVPSIIEIPAVFLMYFVTSWGALIYLLGAQYSIVRAWINRGSDSSYKALLALYAVHLLPYFCFIVWWHCTGRHLN